MTDYRETFADGNVTLDYDPIGDGKIRLTAKHTDSGDVLASGAYSIKIFEYNSIQGSFLNPLQESLAERNGVDADTARREVREWFGEMNAQLQEERENVHELLPPETRQIIEGTESVKVRAGETTTWHVELAFNGHTKEMEFTAAEMTHSGGAALEEQIANEFYEIVEIGEEDWRAIRDHWQSLKEVASVVEETSSDTIADRVLEFLSASIKPVADAEQMGNDVVAAWVDPSNEGGHGDAPADAPIVWVQSSALVEELETAGKNVEYLAKLVKDLIARGDLYGSSARRRWAWDKRVRVYPFTPDALGVDPDDPGAASQPNHSEVDA